MVLSELKLFFKTFLNCVEISFDNPAEIFSPKLQMFSLEVRNWKKVLVSWNKTPFPSNISFEHVECRFGSFSKKNSAWHKFILYWKWWKGEKINFSSEIYSKSTSGHKERSFENPAEFLSHIVQKWWNTYFSEKFLLKTSFWTLRILLWVPYREKTANGPKWFRRNSEKVK